ALVVVPLRFARAQVIGEAVELERAGRQARAAVVYMAVLRGEPTNLAALLGLERVLPPLGRLPELLPLVRRALAADSTNRVFRALEVRTLATLNEPDSAADAARRWIALAPGEGGPYRGWGPAVAGGGSPGAPPCARGRYSSRRSPRPGRRRRRSRCGASRTWRRRGAARRGGGCARSHWRGSPTPCPSPLPRVPARTRRAPCSTPGISLRRARCSSAWRRTRRP